MMWGGWGGEERRRAEEAVSFYLCCAKADLRGAVPERADSFWAQAKPSLSFPKPLLGASIRHPRAPGGRAAALTRLPKDTLNI